MALDKRHPLVECPHGFRVSAYLQELIVFLSSDHVFEQASETFDKLVGIKVCPKQIERFSERMGQIIEDEQVAKARCVEEITAFSACSSEDYHYVEMDGSMVLTREVQWK